MIGDARRGAKYRCEPLIKLLRCDRFPFDFGIGGFVWFMHEVAYSSTSPPSLPCGARVGGVVPFVDTFDLHLNQPADAHSIRGFFI